MTIRHSRSAFQLLFMGGLLFATSGWAETTPALAAADAEPALAAADAKTASEIAAELVSVAAAFTLRASAIVLDIRMGPPGQFLRFGRRQSG